jgi:hypothetical protein
VISRILPPEEYPRLVGTEAETVWPLLPSTARVLVVEDEARIVGCWVLIPVWHAECLWIATEHRGKASVARRLLAMLRRVATAEIVKGIWTAAQDAGVQQLLTKFGAKQVPGEHYIMPIGGA